MSVCSAPAHAEPPCPNEQFRTSLSAALPDCRAYELVSPVDKNSFGAIVQGAASPGLDRASVSGEAITYNSAGSFAEAEGTQYSSQYVSRRGADGWATKGITPPYFATKTSTESAYQSLLFTPTLSAGIAGTTAPLTSDAVAGFENLYLTNTVNASHRLVTTVPQLEEPYQFRETPKAVGASRDLAHVVYQVNSRFYDWTDGQTSLVSVAPNGEPMPVVVPQFGVSFWRAVSSDGLRVVITSLSEPQQLYVRSNPEQPQSPLAGEECLVASDACTISVSASQKTNGSGPGGSDPHGPQPAFYTGASVDGTKVFFKSNEELTNDANTGVADNAANLYEYDLAGGKLTDLTVDANPGDTNGAAVMGVSVVSEDGSYVYFVAEGALTAGAVSGQPNLYVNHGGIVTFITTLGSSDSNDWLGLLGFVGIGSNTVRQTPDGKHFAFLSAKALTGYDNSDAATGNPDTEVFSYDAAAGSLVCVSCNPTGARPVGPSIFGDENPETFQAFGNYVSSNYSNDGGRLFFDSLDSLVARDSNGRQDVYEYEVGHVYPVSDVAGGHDSFFVDASASGSDAFISTEEPLLPQDTGLRADVYDARVNGGLTASVAPPPVCDNADSCKGSVAQPRPAFGEPASATLAGSGNVVPGLAARPATERPSSSKRPRCKKGFVKRAGKCVKPKRCTKGYVKRRGRCVRARAVRLRPGGSGTYNNKGRK